MYKVQIYKCLKKLSFVLISLCIVSNTYAQSSQTINPEGGAGLTDGLKIIVAPNGGLHVYRDNQTQYYSGYTYPSTSGNGVPLYFRFDDGVNYLPEGTTAANGALFMTSCSTTPAVQNGNNWTTSLSGYIKSPISQKLFYVTVNIKYVYPNKYFEVDYYVRAPFDLPTPERIHLYLSHDAYILGKDGSRGYVLKNATGHYVGDYRDATDSGSSCGGSAKNDRYPSAHGFKTAGEFQSYYTGYYGARNDFVPGTFNLTNTVGTTCVDDGVAVEFTIDYLSAGQIGARRVLHCYGDNKTEFDNLVVSNPVVPPGLSSPVTVDFTAASFSENEGDVIHKANITIRVQGGILAQDQIANFTVSGGTAVSGTDYSYVKGIIIPAGDYTTAKVLVLDNINILGNTNCDGKNRTLNVTMDQDLCNDLVGRGSQYTTVYTIVDDDVPTVNQPVSAVYCPGEIVSATTFTGSTLPNTTYNWTVTNGASLGLSQTSGSGDLPSFTAVNNTTAPIVATIIVTPRQGSCNGTTKTFTITVTPRGIASDINVPDQTICYNTKPTLSVNNPVAGATYRWYTDNTTVGNPAATGVTYTPAIDLTANVTYYVSIEKGGVYCENLPANRKPVQVLVLPAVTAGAINGNPYVCSGLVPQTIKGDASTGGSSSFTYQWQSSLDNSTWTNIPSATSKDYTPGALTQNTYFKRISTDSGASCGSFDSNTFLISISPADVVYIWKTNATDNNWNNPNNWTNNKGLTNGVPTDCSEVHIPGGASNYPDLEAGNSPIDVYGKPATENITFHYGAEVAYPHLLNYKKAFVQYNWRYYETFGGLLPDAQPTKNVDGVGAPYLERERWYALAAPLKNMVSGDFALAGYPMTWQALYNTTNPANNELIVGDFSKTFATNDVVLSKTNNALAVKVAAYRTTLGYDNHRDLDNNGLKGIIEVPYFENANIATYRPGHMYDQLSQLSTLFYYNSKTLQQIPSPVGKAVRGNKAYRFIFEDDATDQVGDKGGIKGYKQTVNVTSSSRQVMIGNPFVASINSERFFNANSTVIDKVQKYKVLGNGKIWQSYDYNSTNNIKPLQAFLITLSGSASSVELFFPLEGPNALTGKNFIGNTFMQPVGEALFVNVTNNDTANSDYAVLSLSDQDEDNSNVQKMIFPDGHATPEAFFVSPTDHRYNQVQQIDKQVKEIKLGVKSSDINLPLILRFDNVIHFSQLNNLRPTLVDKFLNIEQDLLDNNVYRFNQQHIVNTTNQYADVNRFVLRLTPSDKDIISTESIVVTYIQSQLEIASKQKLSEVRVYTMLGQEVHFSGVITTFTYNYNKYLPLPNGVYLVKVKTDDGKVVTKKIIVL